jgi:glycosyltransferase involved in cell wall biosynthesis
MTVLGERSDIPDLMAAADVVCLSSRIEGLPMVVLEAMAAGRPIIATAVGGVPDLVTPEVGILVKPESTDDFAAALCTVARDPEQRRTMGQAARARYLENFTMSHVTDSYASLLTQVVAARQGTS